MTTARIAQVLGRGILVLALGGTGYALVPAGGNPAVPQDEPAEWRAALEKKYKDIGSCFTPEQLRELSALAFRKLVDLPPGGIRDRLLSGVQDYLAENYMEYAFAHVGQSVEGGLGSQVELTRTPASWELFQLELERRIDEAIRAPKPQEYLPVITEQIDRLTQAARTRLDATFWGPGAADFVGSAIDRFRKALRYTAESDLEFGFNAPLSAEQFKLVEGMLSSFVPEDAGKDQPLFREKDPTQIFIRDAGEPPPAATNIADFQMFLQARARIRSFSMPKDFYDARYFELRAKANEEMNELSRKIDLDARIQREQRRAELLRLTSVARPPLFREAGKPADPAAAAATGALPLAAGDRSPGSAKVRIPLGLIVLALVGAGVAWGIKRRKKPA